MAKLIWDDTICAIATAPGEGGIGIVRLSGEKAVEIADRAFSSPGGIKLSAQPSHTVHYGYMVSGKDVIDEVMVTLFRAPRTYTKEDMVEISAHGGMKVLEAVLKLLTSKGARIAEPGEFTKRAFLNGRIDLSQAEAVLDLIRAKTDKARDQAVRQLRGEFSKEIGVLKEVILKLCAHVEAYVDFPEEDIEVYTQNEFLEQFKSIQVRLSNLIASFKRGELVRNGVLTVIVGRPNVGKSSLLNALLDRDRAIVSEIPGTTRDALEEQIEIQGIPFRLVDTAGIRSDPDTIEHIGIRKTREYMERADLYLFLLDGSEPVTDEDRKIYEEISKKPAVVAVNKSDLPQKEAWNGFLAKNGQVLNISVKTRAGLKELESVLYQKVIGDRIETDSVTVTNVRHYDALLKAFEAVKKAEVAFQDRLSLEFIAFDLRQALDGLGCIVGEIYTDDVLDVVFKEFCVGK